MVKKVSRRKANIIIKDIWKVSENQVGPAKQEILKIVMPKDYIVKDGPALLKMLAQQ